eukprot:scaffold2253_cov119-Cylindrotheca_fusiformis.AAC.2
MGSKLSKFHTRTKPPHLEYFLVADWVAPTMESKLNETGVPSNPAYLKLFSVGGLGGERHSSSLPLVTTWEKDDLRKVLGLAERRS